MNNFFIPREALKGAGFTYQELFDKDYSDFDNVLVITHAKEIVPGMALEITFGYNAENENEFEQISSTAELIMFEGSVHLNLTNLADIINFCDTITKTFKAVTHDTSISEDNS
jgi:hypothetical protein